MLGAPSRRPHRLGELRRIGVQIGAADLAGEMEVGAGQDMGVPAGGVLGLVTGASLGEWRATLGSGRAGAAIGL